MRAMLVRELGEPSARLQPEDVPEPTPGPDQVLIDVRAVGCNFADILVIQGKYQVKPPLPFAPGLEVAGTVAAVGEGVQHFQVGQRVAALLAWGGYAERAVADVTDVFPLPDAVSFEDAAALGIVYQTSYCALTHRVRLKKGDTLLVHAAAGGVGLAAVQIGKALGARVIATAGSPAKLDIARANGAEVGIDYRAEDWIERVKQETGGRGVDIVYDPVGGDTFDGSTKVIAFEGRILVVGFAGGRIADVATNRILVKNIDVVGVHWGLYRQKAPALVDQWQSALLAMVGSGKLRPVVSRTFPLAQAGAALDFIAGRDSYGKVLLLP
jgi:NADPH2:quinone reductase